MRRRIRGGGGGGGGDYAIISKQLSNHRDSRNVTTHGGQHERSTPLCIKSGDVLRGEGEEWIERRVG